MRNRVGPPLTTTLLFPRRVIAAAFMMPVAARQHLTVSQARRDARLTSRALIAVLLVLSVVKPLTARQADELAEARQALANDDAPRVVALTDKVLQSNPVNQAAMSLKIEALSGARDWETA